MTFAELVKEKISDSNQNKEAVRCQECNSLVLSPLTANYNQSTHPLPLYHQKNAVNVAELECESCDHFWEVKNMYTFDNIGFLNAVGNIKYLICADCERGPIGFHDVESKISYIALHRVKHGS